MNTKATVALTRCLAHVQNLYFMVSSNQKGAKKSPLIKRTSFDKLLNGNLNMLREVASEEQLWLPILWSFLWSSPLCKCQKNIDDAEQPSTLNTTVEFTFHSLFPRAFITKKQLTNEKSLRACVLRCSCLDTTPLLTLIISFVCTFRTISIIQLAEVTVALTQRIHCLLPAYDRIAEFLPYRKRTRAIVI